MVNQAQRHMKINWAYSTFIFFKCIVNYINTCFNMEYQGNTNNEIFLQLPTNSHDRLLFFVILVVTDMPAQN